MNEEKRWLFGLIGLICIVVVTGIVVAAVQYMNLKTQEKMAYEAAERLANELKSMEAQLKVPVITQRTNTSKQTQGRPTIQNKTYKNGKLVDRSNNHHGCVYDGEKKVCLD